MALSNRELFARVIKCEAGGEGVNGMKSVATVIMNRVRVADGEYQRLNQGDIRKVINQEGQFDCMRTVLGGITNPQNVWNMRPDDVHYEIVDWALAGNRWWNIGLSLWYMNPFIPTCPNQFPRNGSGQFNSRIIKHCFYDPTAQYSNT